jgi:hypothetical protein
MAGVALAAGAGVRGVAATAVPAMSITAATRPNAWTSRERDERLRGCRLVSLSFIWSHPR